MIIKQTDKKIEKKRLKKKLEPNQVSMLNL
jgi:hypothetical protein